MHLYPGQIVYLTNEKKIGVYLAYEPGKYTSDEPIVYVYRYTGKGGETSDTYIYEFGEIEPIVMPNKKSITGQEIYKSSFQKPSLSAFIGDKQCQELEPQFLSECAALLKTKWFKEHYEIDLADPADIAETASVEDGKGTN